MYEKTEPMKKARNKQEDPLMNNDTYQHISAEEFSKLDLLSFTLVDLREPDEVLIGGIKGAVNIPFSGDFSGLDEIPQDKPVIVLCRTGNWSEEVAEILADRGYEAASLDGGFQAYKAFLNSKTNPENNADSANEEEKSKENRAAENTEAVLIGNPSAANTDADSAENKSSVPVLVDAKNLKCPGPIVKVADFLRNAPEGTTILAEATEDAFASDIRVWCERTGNRLDELTTEHGIIKARITRSRKQDPPSAAVRPNGKTFVVFSGDLDKTIAAFIMANGAAAMGREVTMFFTFWGLNILRRPGKVRVKKTFIEKMFGSMMPRGTLKLGLSRMNMGGAGAKMIRGIMKKKGISSLEELIESAKAHGVRLVACQMSMDIMGIHREELIDGIELGGVSTFLGSGEESDMSLFI